MHIAILHNADHDLLEDDPGREAREDVTRVASALAHALTKDGVSAEPLAIGPALDFCAPLRARGPALVVNLCESLAADSRGEMVVPSVLELLGIPYTGSSALSLGLALHKAKSKELLRARGIPTPEGCTVASLEELPRLALPFPLIVKPSREDASVGIWLDSVVDDWPALHAAVERVLRVFEQPALVERYIDGREIYVPLLGNTPRHVLPMTEIEFGATFGGRPHVVSYAAKWDLESAECRDTRVKVCQLTEQEAERVEAVARAAFDALECRDYGRVDLRLDLEGIPYVIDINPNCDLHPDAGFARSALAAGMPYSELAERLVQVALKRSHGNTSHLAHGPGVTHRPAGANRNVFAGRSDLRAGAHRRRVQAE